MANANLFLTFRLAEVCWSARSYVYYYALNPQTGNLQRVRIYVNRGTAKNRREYVKRLVYEINKKLLNGWNPFITHSTNTRSLTPIKQAIDSIMSVKTRYIRAESVKSYKTMINHFLWFLDKKGLNEIAVTDFTKTLAVDFMDTVANKNVSATTYNNYLIFFKSMFNIFIEKEYLQINPFAKLRPLPEKQTGKTYFKEDQLEQYVDYVKKNEPNFYIVSGLLYYCAIRPKEICLLKVGDIDFNNKTIEVSADVSKSKRVRYAPIPLPFFEVLKEHCKGAKPSEYLISRDYKPGSFKLVPQRFGETFREIRDKLKLPKNITFYSLKDTCAERLLRAGFNIKQIRDLFGHSSIAITDSYLKRIRTTDEKLINEFPEL